MAVYLTIHLFGLPKRPRKKRGVGQDSPLGRRPVVLEKESQAELQLSHAVWCIRRGVSFDRTDYAASAAVDAGIALRGTEAQNGMVEHVVGIKAELRSIFLRNVEVLRHRHVGEERVRPAQPIPSRIADTTAGRQAKWAGGCPGERATILTGQVRG